MSHFTSKTTGTPLAASHDFRCCPRCHPAITFKLYRAGLGLPGQGYGLHSMSVLYCLDILIRVHGNVAGIAVFVASPCHVADGIAVMHQTIALVLVGMICFIISAVYLYSFFAGQFNERLRGVFGFGPCRAGLSDGVGLHAPSHFTSRMRTGPSLGVASLPLLIVSVPCMHSWCRVCSLPSTRV